MLYMILVFGHLLATSMALGAIVATDLRMLSKLAQDRVRIPPPNDFVARLVTIALLMLYATGAGMLWIGSQGHPDFFNPKLQGKLVLVLLLTFNAVVLHRYTFPRLARGRSVARWHLLDWVIVVLPVSLSNCLWMFCAFLGIARPWNHSMPMRDVLEIAASLYLLALFGVGIVLAAAARQSPEGRRGALISVLKKSLASVGSLGKHGGLQPEAQQRRPRASQALDSRHAAAAGALRRSASRARHRAAGIKPPSASLRQA